MYKIKTYNKISEKGLGIFNKDVYSVSDATESPDALILRSYKLSEEAINDEVSCIARAGAGVNNIPVDACSEKGVVVFNTPGANANGVKELVICGLLLGARDVAGALKFAASIADSPDDVSKTVEGNKSKFAGPEIKGKTLGVIGLGAIGALVANAASDLGMDVIGYDPFLSVESAWGLSRKVKKASSIDEIYKNSDYITIHVPLLDATKGMINSETISKMKNGVRILNFSRGGLVDETSISDGLNSGSVERYITDFPSRALLSNPKAVCIPHLGASTYESEINCAVMAVNQIIDFLETGNIVNSVNFPKCQMEQTSSLRLSVIHKNISGMLGQLSSILEKNGIIIEEMINKGRGDYAYTMLDTGSEIDENTMAEIKAIDGVLKARIIKK